MNESTLFFPITLLVFISIIDELMFWIPDVFILSLVGYRLTQPLSGDHLVSIGITGILLYSLKKIADGKIHRPSMGGGDVKLILCCSSFLAPEALGYFFFLSGILGILSYLLRYGLRKGGSFPFATDISIGFLVSLKSQKVLEILDHLV